MSEDESADPGTRAIIALLSGRKANEAIDEEEQEDREANEAFDEDEREDRGTSTISQFPQHPAPANPVKQKKGSNDPPGLEPTRGLAGARRQGDRLRSQPMEFDADDWRRGRSRPKGRSPRPL